MVSQEKRNRVMEAVKTLNYLPNTVGRNLRRAESKMVLVVSSIVIQEVLAGIQEFAKELGYDVILSYVGNIKGNIESIKFLQNSLVDGVIFSNVSFGTQELDDISKQYPVVQCMEYVDIPDPYIVSVDDEKAAYDVVSHLIHIGRKKIGIISLDEEDNPRQFVVDRERGYKRALLDHGLRYDPDLKIIGDHSYESGSDAARQFFNMENRPDAVFSLSDTMAVGCLNTMKSLGASIPDDIAIVGFDNNDIAKMCEPKLTTIAQPFYELGRETMRMMVSLLKGEISTGRRVLLNHQLIVRGSSVKQKI
jgi:DNA-binding LacI/PurR family transcriptional regulator